MPEPVTHVYEMAAVRIVDWLHRAEVDLLDHVVTTFNGEAGLVRGVTLNDLHGLCFTFEEKPNLVFRDGLPPVRWYPVATIKLYGPKEGEPCNTSTSQPQSLSLSVLQSQP